VRTVHTWTKRELHALYARRAAGEPTIALAAEVGVTAVALRRAWAYSGLRTAALYANRRVHPHDEHLYRRAYILHTEGNTWRDVASALDWQMSVNTLRSRVHRWAVRASVVPTWRGATPRANAQRLRARRGE